MLAAATSSLYNRTCTHASPLEFAPAMKYLPCASTLVLLTLLAGSPPASAEEKPAPPDEPEKEITPAEILAAGDIPAAGEVLKQLPAAPSAAQLEALRKLDQKFDREWTPAAVKLRRKLLQVLVDSGELYSHGYLHSVYESTAARRPEIAYAISQFALTQRLKPADWRILVRSLPLVDGADARSVLAALKRFRRRATKPEWQRQALLAGLRLGNDGGELAVALLQHWTGEKIGQDLPTGQALAAWQEWFRGKYAQLCPPELPADPPQTKHKFEPLLAFLQSKEGRSGDPAAGKQLFEKTNCLKCHRVGGSGEPMGPDLTSMSVRYHDRQMLESILFPSQNIDEQYATWILETKDGRILKGVTSRTIGGDIQILQPNGEKAVLKKTEVEAFSTSNVSAMPTGLLDQLSREQIADLFAYIRTVSLRE